MREILKEAIIEQKITTSKNVFAFLLSTACKLIEKDITSLINDLQESQKNKVSTKITKASFQIIEQSIDTIKEQPIESSEEDSDDVFF